MYVRTAAEKRYQSLKPFTLDKNDCNEQVWQIRNLMENGMTRSLGLSDRCTAHYSIEKRYPFWDKRLIMFCLSLPASQKLDTGYNRVIMRRAMEPILPPKVCWRGGKTNLSPHANQLLLELMKTYQLPCSETTTPLWSYLDRQKVEKMFESAEDFLHKNTIHLYYIAGLMLWLDRR